MPVVEYKGQFLNYNNANRRESILERQTIKLEILCYLEAKKRIIWQLYKIVQNDHDNVKICLYKFIIIILNDKIYLPLSITIACSICEWCAIQVTDIEANLGFLKTTEKKYVK